MSGNYPPGMSHRDFVRAGIVDDGEPCPDCGRSITTEDDHEDGCRLSGNDKTDLVEDAEAAKAERQLEERRLEEAREARDNDD